MLFFGPESARPGLQAEDDLVAKSENGIERHPSLSPSNGAKKHPRENGPNGNSDSAVQPPSKRSRNSDGYSENRRIEELSSQQIALLPQRTDVETPTDVGDSRLDTEVTLPDSNANSAGVGFGRPEPDAKSLAASDADEDADMDMGSSNGVVQGLESANGSLAGVERVGKAKRDEPINELPALVPTLDGGFSVGVQAGAFKSPDSGLPQPESTILQVADDCHVTSVTWRPSDPTALAVFGQDFAAVWTTPTQSLSELDRQPVFRSIVDKSDEWMVTAMAWEPGGTRQAIALLDHYTASTVRIYDGHKMVLTQTLPGPQGPSTSLCWRNTGSLLLGLANSSLESTLTLWDLAASPSSIGTSTFSIPEQINDVQWASEGNTSIICAAGDGVLYQCQTMPLLAVENRWTSAPDEPISWSLIRCSQWSEEASIIIAASAHPPHIWIPTKDVYVKDVHSASLTCLELRPNPANRPSQEPSCDFVTSSIDGTIKMWRYHDRAALVECLFRLPMVAALPVLALAWPPHASALAAASYDTVILFDAEKRAPCIEKWHGQEDVWAGARIRAQRQLVLQGETMSEDGVREDTEHALAWRPDGRTLAFALGSQVQASIASCFPLLSHPSLLFCLSVLPSSFLVRVHDTFFGRYLYFSRLASICLAYSRSKLVERG